MNGSQTTRLRLRAAPLEHLLGALIGLVFLAGAGCAEAPCPELPVNGETDPTPRPVVVGLLTGQGVWDDGHSALVSILEAEDPSALELRHLRLSEIASLGVPADVDVVLVGGGWAYDQWQDLGSAGVRRLRQFVLRGGGYLGICAGAYLASDDVVWEGIFVAYPLNLFDGFAVGPLDEIEPWPGARVISVEQEVGAHSLQVAAADSLPMLYFGGAAFDPRDPEGIDVLLRYPDGAIAALAQEIGYGRVVLSAVHPELGALPGAPHGEHAEARAWLLSALTWAAKP